MKQLPWWCLLIAAAACGPGGDRRAVEPVDPALAATSSGGLEVAFVAARAAQPITQVTADAGHVYWSDGDSIYRRGHGAEAAVETVLADAGVVDALVIAGDTLYVLAATALVSVPATGGTPRKIATLDAAPWGVVAGAGGIVIGVGERLDIHGAGEPRSWQAPLGAALLAVEGERAYVTVSDEMEPRVVEIDLTTGGIVPGIYSWEITYGLEMAAGGSLFLTTNGGLLTMDRSGQVIRRMTHAGGRGSESPHGVVADSSGYVALLGHLLFGGTETEARLLGGDDGRLRLSEVGAIAGANVYVAASDLLSGEHLLLAVARAGGQTLVDIEACRDRGGVIAANRFYCGNWSSGLGVLDLSTGVVETLAIDGWGAIDVAISAEHAVYRYDRALYRVALTGGDSARIAEVSSNIDDLTLDRDRVLWSDGHTILQGPIDGSVPGATLLERGIRRGGAAGPSARTFAVVDDDVYATDVDADHARLVRIDKQRVVTTVWELPLTESDPPFSADIVTIGRAAYLHDGSRIVRIPLAGGDAITFDGGSPGSVRQLHAVAGRLIVSRIEDGAGKLVELPLDGGAPRTLWSGPELAFDEVLDGGDALWIRVGRLQRLLRVALDP